MSGNKRGAKETRYTVYAETLRGATIYGRCKTDVLDEFVTHPTVSMLARHLTNDDSWKMMLTVEMVGLRAMAREETPSEETEDA
jgi:hypothetical protein